jgi:hypothetical protein
MNAKPHTRKYVQKFITSMENINGVNISWCKKNAEMSEPLNCVKPLQTNIIWRHLGVAIDVRHLFLHIKQTDQHSGRR